MKRATSISEFEKVFITEPLQEDNLDMFYYDGTMKARIGDVDDISPIKEIYDRCTTTTKSAFLLLGHKGCGKSTELNELKKDLKKENYLVENIDCYSEIDMISPAVWDLLLLITEKLLRIADEIKCKIDKNTLDSLLNCFRERTEVKEFIEEAGFNLEGEIKAESPSFLKFFFNILAKLSAEVKVGESTRKIIREVVEKRSSTWIIYVNQIADVIAYKNNGKRPVLIVEDSDKMNPAHAEEIFFNNARTLSGMSFHIIYTFPISLSYRPAYTGIQGYYSDKILPIIKIKNPDNSKCDDGIEAIRKIIEKRASLELFEKGVIDLLIEKTGGSLRDLFEVIVSAMKRANNRGNRTIELVDAERALIKLKSNLTRRIEDKDYQFLQNIKDGNVEYKKKIKDKNKLLEMMQAQAVLEYNGERWHDVHPLVSDFLDIIGKE